MGRVPPPALMLQVCRKKRKPEKGRKDRVTLRYEVFRALLWTMSEAIPTLRIVQVHLAIRENCLPLGYPWIKCCSPQLTWHPTCTSVISVRLSTFS